MSNVAICFGIDAEQRPDPLDERLDDGGRSPGGGAQRALRLVHHHDDDIFGSSIGKAEAKVTTLARRL